MISSIRSTFLFLCFSLFPTTTFAIICDPVELALYKWVIDRDYEVAASINPTKRAAFINAFPQALRADVEAFINRIEQFRVADLKIHMKEAFTQIETASGPNDIILGYSVGEVGIDVLQNDSDLPKIKSGQYFTGYALLEKPEWMGVPIITELTPEKLQLAMKFGRRKLVYTDDVVVSGIQIKNWLEYLANNLSDEMIDKLEIEIVVPSTTQKGYDKVMGIASNLGFKVSWKPRNILPVIGNDVDSDEEEAAEEFGDNLAQALTNASEVELFGMQGIGLALFDHHVPDFQSFPDWLVKGLVFDMDGNVINRIPFIEFTKPGYKRILDDD